MFKIFVQGKKDVGINVSSIKKIITPHPLVASEGHSTLVTINGTEVVDGIVADLVEFINSNECNYTKFMENKKK